MHAFSTYSAQQWRQLIVSGLLLAVIMVVVLAVLLPTAALVLTLALVAMGVSLITQRVSSALRAPHQASRAGTMPEDAVAPTLYLKLADGVVVAARPIPLPAAQDHSLLLTRDGYVVVNAEGRIIHSIR